MRYRKRTSIIFIFNAVAFLYVGAITNISFQKMLLPVIGIIMLIYGIYCMISQPRRKGEYITVYILAALVWIAELNFWPVGVIMLLLMLLNWLAEKRTVTTVSDNGIMIGNYRSRQIEWHDIDNVIMKDGLLSVDMKNNRIFQAEPDFSMAVTVRSTTTGSLDDVQWNVGEDYREMESSFNAYAQGKLQR